MNHLSRLTLMLALISIPAAQFMRHVAAQTLPNPPQTRPDESPVLQPGDHLRIRIAYDNDQAWGQSCEAPVVDKAGDIEVSDLGKLHVAGETIKTLEDQVKAGLQNLNRATFKVNSVTIDMIPHAASQNAAARPGDHLKVSMFELETPGVMSTLEVVIDDEGNVQVASLGKINVAGLDQNGIEKIILQRVIELASVLHPYNGPVPQLSVQILPAAPRPASTAQSQPATTPNI